MTTTLPAPSSRARYVLCGVCYSDNLGDGVIADALEFLLKEQDAGAELARIDISGRTGFQKGMLPGKTGILKLIDRLPAVLRPVVTIPGLVAVLLKGPLWRWGRVLQKGDRLVIGGGQLISHVNHNFPVKLAALVALAKLKGCRHACFTVGVSKGWDAISKGLFVFILKAASPVLLGVRDIESRTRMAKGAHVPESSIMVCPDPAVVAHAVYAKTKPTAKGIGINLADPAALKHHVTKAANRAFFETEEHLKVWSEVITALAEQGHTVNLFTNGAREDKAFLNLLVERLEQQGKSSLVNVLPWATQPQELVAQIKGLDLLIAHRLHAHIVAYSMKVPAIALAWDDKLEGFLKGAGEAECLLPSDMFGTAALLKRIASTLGTSRKAPRLAEMEAEVRNGISKLVVAYGQH